MLNNEDSVLDKFEERYVGFYRWLLLIIGLLSLVAFLALVLSLTWSTSDTTLNEAADYFEEPRWNDLRREVLPLRMKPESRPSSEKQVRKQLPVDKRVVEIQKNLLRQFSADEMDEAKKYFPTRLLNEWLLEEIPVPLTWRDRMFNDLVGSALIIGEDDRIRRIGSIDGRAKIVMQGFETFVTNYLERIDFARSEALQEMAQKDAEKALITTQVLIAIPVTVGIFLSMIGLILLIRMELHLRKLAHDYRLANTR